jgi:hypothetical protein
MESIAWCPSLTSEAAPGCASSNQVALRCLPGTAAPRHMDAPGATMDEWHASVEPRSRPVFSSLYLSIRKFPRAHARAGVRSRGNARWHG